MVRHGLINSKGQLTKLFGGDADPEPGGAATDRTARHQLERRALSQASDSDAYARLRLLRPNQRAARHDNQGRGL